MATWAWRAIRAEHSKVTPDRQAEIDNAVQIEIASMHFAELRRARHLSQMQIADALNMRQGDVSRLERQTDMYLSMLARLVAAFGSRLRVVAGI